MLDDCTENRRKYECRSPSIVGAGRFGAMGEEAISPWRKVWSGRELIGPLSEELEESCREEGGWPTGPFHNGAEGDLMGLSSVNGTLACLRSGRLFFKSRLGRRPETWLDPAYDALRTCARVSEAVCDISSSVDKSRKSS